MSMMHAVASGQAELKDLEWLLKNPRKGNYDRYAFKLAPPGGLYLKQVLYDERHFDDPKPSFAHGWDELPEGDEEMEVIEDDVKHESNV